MLLYGNTFSPTEVRLITESADFAARLPRLFQRAFGLKFDRLPEEERREADLRHHRPEQAGPHHQPAGLRSPAESGAPCELRPAGGRVLPDGLPAWGLSGGRQRHRPGKALPSGAGYRPCAGQPGGGGPADGDGLSAPQRPPGRQLRYLLQAVRAYRGSADHHRGTGGGYGYHDRQGG